MLLDLGSSGLQQELSLYSTASLVEILHRFDVPGAEVFFRNLAASKFPPEIAEVWTKHFNKSRSFAAYAPILAEELFARLIGPSPRALARELGYLFAKLQELLEGRVRSRPELAFEKVEKLVRAIPSLPELLAVDLSQRTRGELERLVPDALELFETLPEQLVSHGRSDLAERLVQVQEQFNPQGVPLAVAGLKAARRDRMAAIEVLLAIAGDPLKSAGIEEALTRRLIMLGAVQEARRCATTFISDLQSKGRVSTSFQELIRVLRMDEQPAAEGTGGWSTRLGHAPSTTVTWRLLRERRTSAAEVLRFFNVFTLPVDVEALVSRLGVRLLTMPSKQWRGYMELSEDRETVVFWINASESYPVRRFTMAFLLGHLLCSPLDRLHQRTVDTKKTDPDVERALAFATTLLIPPEVLAPRAAASTSPNPIHQLARMFRVSTSAMRYALDNLQRQ